MHLSHLVETIDTHTAGNPTRNLIAGVPRIKGKTMRDKMAYAEEHLDWLRTAVMMEPRGHSNMSGTIWVEPCHPEADMGILFIDAGGHMPMCGHSTIGCVTAMLESGRVPITGEVTEVNIDTPAGLVRTRATVENGSVTSVAFRNVPSFLFCSGTVEVPGIGAVPFDVAYGGNTYAIADAAYFPGLELRSGHRSAIEKAAQAFGDAVRAARGVADAEYLYVISEFAERSGCGCAAQSGTHYDNVEFSLIGGADHFDFSLMLAPFVGQRALRSFRF